MKHLLPIAAIVCTLFTTLMMLVLMLAGAANSTPEQLRSMQLWAGGLSLLSLVCVIAGVVLMAKGRAGRAAVIAFLPTFIMGCIFLVLLM